MKVSEAEQKERVLETRLVTAVLANRWKAPCEIELYHAKNCPMMEDAGRRILSAQDASVFCVCDVKWGAARVVGEISE